MRWYGEEGGEDFAKGFHVGGEEVPVADLVVHVLEVPALFEVAPGGEAVVELVAGELDLLAVVVVLNEADEVAGGEARIVEGLEDALGGEVTGLVLEPGGFLRIGGRRGRGGVLLAAPLENVGAVEAPDRHAGGGYTVVLAEVGAFLPTVAGAGRRVIEEEEEFVEEGDGLAAGILGALQPVKERGESRDFQRSGSWLIFVGVGREIRIYHKAASLRQAEEGR
jgi:hypothetical protein